ncbi:MAG: glycosyltransferase family 4 protein [Deltaproteobacteria bacterium]|nr:glycosyltransferase family 4 protein [Deltaproteobacteria bacterium]MBI3387991.1 glycosyltransferase family 4 protein [Deltaproteobacteria bacterium]
MSASPVVRLSAAPPVMLSPAAMQVIYSFGSAVGASGLGTDALHEARALHQHGALRRLLCGFSRATDVPAAAIRALGLRDRALRKLASYDRSERLLHLQNLQFDRWASRRMEPADVFVVWNTWGLQSLQHAKRMGLRTAVLRYSTDPRHSTAVLAAEHARWGFPYRPPAVRLRRKVAELETADAILVSGAYAKSTYVQQGVAGAKVVALAGSGADPRVYVPAACQGQQPFRILFVGAINLGKGVPYLLDAWRRLQWRDAELVLVGAVGPQIRALLTRDGVPENFHMPGYVPHPIALYQSADVFVLPTLDEGSPKVIYEAMACGLPVITTPAAGSEVRDGIEGFVVPVRDAEAIAARLELLRTDERLRGEMGRAARARAERCSWDTHGDEFVAALAAL